MPSLYETLAARAAAQAEPPAFERDAAVEREEMTLARLKERSPREYDHPVHAPAKARVLAYRNRERLSAERAEDAAAAKEQGR